MTSIAKVLVPDSEWLIQDDQEKVAGITKAKKGYTVFRKGSKIEFTNLSEIKHHFGISLIERDLCKIKDEQSETNNYSIYGFPCDSMPYDPVYSVKKKLPIYTKGRKSKSHYCAGYYAVKIRRGWVNAYCPKLITLERYAYHGPFKSESELDQYLDNTIHL
jgi:hypothetical protein